jgi:hypothetical protein
LPNAINYKLNSGQTDADLFLVHPYLPPHPIFRGGDIGDWWLKASYSALSSHQKLIYSVIIPPIFAATGMGLMFTKIYLYPWVLAVTVNKFFSILVTPGLIFLSPSCSY